MTPPPFLNADWKQIFANNNLPDFNALWDLKTGWFEEPNIRRGGWSGVVKIDLDTPEGKVGVFIKRQENHITKTFLNPIEGRPTFEREFKNLLRLQKKNVPTLEPVYFSTRNLQAILITRELEGYIPFDSERFLSSGDMLKDKAHRERLLRSVANTLRLMHKQHFQHNCLYLKHIFIKPIDDEWDVKIIDLEKLKKTIFKRSAVFRDLYTLCRHVKNWSAKDQVTFYKYYCQETKLSNQSKRLWKAIERKIILKRRN